MLNRCFFDLIKEVFKIIEITIIKNDVNDIVKGFRSENRLMRNESMLI